MVSKRKMSCSIVNVLPTDRLLELTVALLAAPAAKLYEIPRINSLEKYGLRLDQGVEEGICALWTLQA